MPLQPESSCSMPSEASNDGVLVNIDDLEVGSYIDVLDSVNTWSEAKVRVGHSLARLVALMFDY